MNNNRFGLTDEEVGKILEMVQHYIGICYTYVDREALLHDQLALVIMAKDLTSTNDLSRMDILPWARLLCAAADFADWAVGYTDHFTDIQGNDVLIKAAHGEVFTDFVKSPCSIEDFIKACLERIE